LKSNGPTSQSNSKLENMPKIVNTKAKKLSQTFSM
jgi:hypothetical protein